MARIRCKPNAPSSRYVKPRRGGFAKRSVFEAQITSAEFDICWEGKALRCAKPPRRGFTAASNGSNSSRRLTRSRRCEAASHGVLGDRARQHELQQIIRPARLGADAATA